MTQTPLSFSHGIPQARMQFRCSSGEHQYIASVLCRMKAYARLARTLLSFCVLSQMMLGQTEPPAIAKPEPKDRIAQAVRVERSPRLDGTLDDPIWQQASPITDFKQREPYEEQSATERTEVRVLYSRNEVYFGIACHDSASKWPKEVIQLPL